MKSFIKKRIGFPCSIKSMSKGISKMFASYYGMFIIGIYI
jgi:hypothetical protein